MGPLARGWLDQISKADVKLFQILSDIERLKRDWDTGLKEASTYFVRMSEGVRPFVLSGEIVTRAAAMMKTVGGDYPSLPFPAISFEVSGRAFLGAADAEALSLVTIYREEAVGEISVCHWALTGKNHPGNQLQKDVFACLHGPAEVTDYSFLNAIIAQMRTAEVGRQKSSYRHRIGSGSERRLIKIPHVTYVRGRSAEQERVFPQRDINWTHRWEVMGHWRKVSGTGKDREGNYTVSGMTWVNNHIRGPDELELVRKTRKVI